MPDSFGGYFMIAALVLFVAFILVLGTVSALESRQTGHDR